MTNNDWSGYGDVFRKPPPSDEEEVISGTVQIPIGNGFFADVLTPDTDSDPTQTQTLQKAGDRTRTALIATGSVLAALAIVGLGGKAVVDSFNSMSTSERATSAAPSVLPVPQTPSPSSITHVPLPSATTPEQVDEGGVWVDDLIDDALAEPSPTPVTEPTDEVGTEAPPEPTAPAPSTRKPSTPNPSARPTPKPSVKPTPKPTPTPTIIATPTPTLSPTPTPIETLPTSESSPTISTPPAPTETPTSTPTEEPTPMVSPTIIVRTESAASSDSSDQNKGFFGRWRDGQREEVREVRDEVAERLRQNGFIVEEGGAGGGEEAFMTLVVGGSVVSTQVGYGADFDPRDTTQECVTKKYAQEIGSRVLGKRGFVTPKFSGNQAVYVDVGTFSKNHALPQKLSAGVGDAYEKASEIVADCNR